MLDRQEFQEHTLPNKIRVYSHAMDVPFFDLSVVIPIGSSHAIPGNPGGVPGIAHFLEHVVLNRSKGYPEKDSFTQKLSLKGAYVNASTGPYRTRIYGTAPVEIQDELIAGLFDHVWAPILDNEKDLALERTIVANERNQRKYFPGSTELGKYLISEWMHDEPVSKTRVFGTDADLESMQPAALSAFHDLYFSDSVQVVVGGGHAIEPILKELGRISTHATTAKQEIQPVTWNHREYHERSFKDIDTPTYYYGGIVPFYDYQTSYAIGFMLGLLTNDVHGPLYQWMRKDNGWTYGVSYSAYSDPDRTSWRIEMPLNHREPLEQIRAEIDTRIRDAIQDEALVSKEVERRLYNDIYGFQTLDERMSQAMHSLRMRGRIVSEQEYQEMNKSMKDMKLLMDIYEKYLSPGVTGEFLALPETPDQVS